MKEVLGAVLAALIISFFGTMFTLSISEARTSERLKYIDASISEIVPRSELDKEFIAIRSVTSDIKLQMGELNRKFDKLLIALAQKGIVNGRLN